METNLVLEPVVKYLSDVAISKLNIRDFLVLRRISKTIRRIANGYLFQVWLSMKCIVNKNDNLYKVICWKDALCGQFSGNLEPPISAYIDMERGMKMYAARTAEFRNCDSAMAFLFFIKCTQMKSYRVCNDQFGITPGIYDHAAYDPEQWEQQGWEPSPKKSGIDSPERDIEYE